MRVRKFPCCRTVISQSAKAQPSLHTYRGLWTAGRSLIPEEQSQQAKWLEWCFFIVTELDSTSLYVMRRHGTNKGLAHIYGEAPVVVSKAGEYSGNNSAMSKSP